MKIAFCNRKNYDNPLGGDGVQMHKTKFYLEQEYDIQIDIIVNPNDLNQSYDIVHIFNYLTIDETLSFFEKAKNLNIKIVSSSIYWDYSYSSTHVFSKIFGTPDFISEKRINFQRSIIRFITLLTNRPIGISPKLKKYCQIFTTSSSYILPNSKEEGEKLLAFCDPNSDINSKKIRVVFNATDFIDTQNKTDVIEEKISFLSKYKIPADYILQVGRIEYIKNQLNLLYSLMDYPNIPIVFVGKVFEKEYFDKLNKLASKRGNVFFIANVEHADIKDFYKYAKVHVLLSLRESPGLVSLEALSMNCPIVVSDNRFAPTSTYFKDTAFITNPLNEKDIKEKVLKAYNTPRTIFPELIFTWKKAAEQTYNVYLECLSKK
jgi:glycosyltransferase involved in cell wall biosynthesis